jgi:hypothetical protein
VLVAVVLAAIGRSRRGDRVAVLVHRRGHGCAAFARSIAAPASPLAALDDDAEPLATLPW